MEVALETSARGSERAEPFSGARRMLGDEQLARRIAAGDRDAFTVIYDRHLPALTRYCRSILLNPEDAEDAAQNAMIAALRSLPGRPPQLKLRAWLFRVAHNEAISLIRKRRPHEDLEQAVDVSSLDVAETVEVRARLRQLVTDLRSLPERQRAALILRELCDLSYEEIAGVLECSEAAVMQTVFEARSALSQFEDGRTMSCTGVQRMISDGDRRSLRARRVRAHMRSCDMCRTFAFSLDTRRSHLALLFPVGAAVKGGFGPLLAVLGLVGGGPKAKVAAAILRLQSTTGLRGLAGLRGVAAGVLLAAGGGMTAAQLSHHAHANVTRTPKATVVTIHSRHRSGPGAGGHSKPIQPPHNPSSQHSHHSASATFVPRAQSHAGGGAWSRASGSPASPPERHVSQAGGSDGGIHLGVGSAQISAGAQLSVATSAGVHLQTASAGAHLSASVTAAETTTASVGSVDTSSTSSTVSSVSNTVQRVLRSTCLLGCG
jgi:RNA polymerase sigma factor (sigma-70 family)